MTQTTLLELLSEYQNLISCDHHKDRDCHFSVSREFSYGDEVGWTVSHYGYCNRENDSGYSECFHTYSEAEEHLKSLLTAWIKKEKEAPNYD